MWSNILLSVGGLILFLYGILELNVVVQKFFSVRIRSYIHRAVQKPIYGIFVGIVSAVLAQSSSASNILTISLVSAGLITFYQSLGILLGAGIGGTVVAQLVAFKISNIAPLFILVGFILWQLTHGKKRIFGEMIFYFGLLFFGLGVVGSSIDFLHNSQFLLNLLTAARLPIVGLFVGAVAAVVLQGSAVPIGLMVLFAQKGLVGLESAMPIVLGACLGTTIDVGEIFATLTSKKGGQRVALANVLFKLLGVILVLIFFNSFLALLKIVYSQTSYQIALGNLLFALIVAVIGLIILKPFSNLIKKILPDGEKSILLWPEYLDKRHIAQPKLALNNTLKELERMASIAQGMFVEASSLSLNFSPASFRSVEYTELVADNLQKEILVYLDKVSEQKMSQEESSRLLYYSIIVDDIERLADLSLNIAKLGHYQRKYHICLSQKAVEELKHFIDLTLLNINEVISLFANPDPEVIKRIIAREDETYHLYTQYRQNHFARFFAGTCSAEAGPIFIGLLSNLERISDHCKNIADYWQELKDNYL